jgi:hypothetical protein
MRKIKLLIIFEFIIILFLFVTSCNIPNKKSESATVIPAIATRTVSPSSIITQYQPSSTPTCRPTDIDCWESNVFQFSRTAYVKTHSTPTRTRVFDDSDNLTATPVAFDRNIMGSYAQFFQDGLALTCSYMNPKTKETISSDRCAATYPIPEWIVHIKNKPFMFRIVGYAAFSYSLSLTDAFQRKTDDPLHQGQIFVQPPEDGGANRFKPANVLGYVILDDKTFNYTEYCGGREDNPCWSRMIFQDPRLSINDKDIVAFGRITDHIVPGAFLPPINPEPGFYFPEDQYELLKRIEVLPIEEFHQWGNRIYMVTFAPIPDLHHMEYRFSHITLEFDG